MALRAVLLPSAAGSRLEIGHASARLRPSTPALFNLALTLFIPLAKAQATISAEIATCPGGAATVIGANPTDRSDVCAGMTSALGLLALHDVKPTEWLALEVTTAIPHQAIQAKEYLAYVAMFSVMPTELRYQALPRVKTEGFASMDRFTPLLYSFDPMRFGAQAYRHLSSSTDQTAIIQGLLAGTTLRDQPLQAVPPSEMRPLETLPASD